MSGSWLRGSTRQCPKCGRRRVVVDPAAKIAGYGPGLATCVNCKTIWEPFDPAQIWDRTDDHCSFRDQCSNCAFRPGSPEQADHAKWRELIGQLKKGSSFYCHKGVPIDPDAEDGFAYPRDADGKPIVAKLRLCRGYLNALTALHRSAMKDAAE